MAEINGMVRSTYYVEEDLHRKFKEWCIVNDTSMTQQINYWIKQCLTKLESVDYNNSVGGKNSDESGTDVFMQL